MRHFAFQELCPPAPLLQLLVFLGEPVDLFDGITMNAHLEANAIHGPAGLDRGHGGQLQEGRGQIDEFVAGVSQDAMTDPAQNQQNRAEKIEAEAEQLHRRRPGWPVSLEQRWTALRHLRSVSWNGRRDGVRRPHLEAPRLDEAIVAHPARV